MNSLLKPLKIEYLAIEQTGKLDSIIEQKFARLNNVCDYIIKCQVKIANITHNRQKQSNSLYMASISITTPEGFDIYTLRSPQNKQNDSVEKAIADVFAMIYRKLIELKLENQFKLV
ncbi:MAG: HPF/RaiA family ribosome-associated protein [Pleurocapsa sp.]